MKMNRLQHIKRRWFSVAWFCGVGMIIMASLYGINSRQAWSFLILTSGAWAVRDLVTAMECFLEGNNTDATE